MTKKMIEDLLQSITALSDELKDAQINAYHTQELIKDLEYKMNYAGFRVLWLQQDIFQINRKFILVVDFWRTRKDTLVSYKAVI